MGTTDPVLALDVTVEQRFDAPPEQVFALLTDVEQMAGLGPEHVAAWWTTPGPAVGATFTGRNTRGEMTWEVPCTVVVCDPPRAFGWVVGAPEQPTTTWTYALSDDGSGGTVVAQRVQHGPGRSYLRDACERRPDQAERYVAGRAAELADGMGTVLRAAAARLAAG